MRIGVVGGGCSGFQYSLNFDTRKEGDRVTDFGGVPVYIDNFAAVYRGHDARLRRGTARRRLPFRQSPREPHLWLWVVVQRIVFSLIDFARPFRSGGLFLFKKGRVDESMMLAGLLYWLSPARRRFMRRLAKSGLDATRARLAEAGSPRAVQFISTLLDANADFLAYALSPKGPLKMYCDRATPDTVAACIVTMLIYSVNLFARDEMTNNEAK